MTQLLVIREKICSFIAKNEGTVVPISKFVFALITLVMININVGFAPKLTNFAIVLIIALMASFLPLNFIIIADGLLILLHLYSLSVESVAVVSVLLLLMYLLYFRFSPKDTILLVLTPICFVLKVPYIVPLAAGLVSGLGSAVAIGCGTMIYYILAFISQNETALSSGDSESALVKLKFLIEQMLFNKEMLIVILAFTFTIIVVNIIRRLSVDHAWPIAIATGALSDIVIILIGDLKYGTYISVVGLILGSIVAVLVTVVIKFFVFNVDYNRTERVQFEDDEYYYYVKAVPKNNVAIAETKIKKIKGQEKNSESKLDSTRNSASGVHREVRSARAREDVQDYNLKRTSNKTSSKRIIGVDETVENGEVVKAKRHIDSNGLTEIERAAAIKAKAQRKK